MTVWLTLTIAHIDIFKVEFSEPVVKINCTVTLSTSLDMQSYLKETFQLDKQQLWNFYLSSQKKEWDLNSSFNAVITLYCTEMNSPSFIFHISKIKKLKFCQQFLFFEKPGCPWTFYWHLSEMATSKSFIINLIRT